MFSPLGNQLLDADLESLRSKTTEGKLITMKLLFKLYQLLIGVCVLVYCFIGYITVRDRSRAVSLILLSRHFQDLDLAGMSYMNSSNLNSTPPPSTLSEVTPTPLPGLSEVTSPPLPGPSEVTPPPPTNSSEVTPPPPLEPSETTPPPPLQPSETTPPPEPSVVVQQPKIYPMPDHFTSFVKRRSNATFVATPGTISETIASEIVPGVATNVALVRCFTNEVKWSGMG